MVIFLHAQHIIKQSKHRSSGKMPTVQASHVENCIAPLDMQQIRAEWGIYAPPLQSGISTSSPTPSQTSMTVAQDTRRLHSNFGKFMWMGQIWVLFFLEGLSFSCNRTPYRDGQASVWWSKDAYTHGVPHHKLSRSSHINGSALVFRNTTRQYTTISIQIPVDSYTGPVSVVGQA